MTTDRCMVEDCDREISDRQGYVCESCGNQLRRLLGALADVPVERPRVLQHPHLPEHELCDDCGLGILGHPVVNVLRETGLPALDPGLVADLERAMTKASLWRPPDGDREAGVTRGAYAYGPAEARWTLRDTLTHVGDEIARVRGLHRPYNSLQALGAWLVEQVEWMRHHPGGADLIEELTYCMRAGLRAIDNPGKRLLIGACDATIADEQGMSVECGAQLYAREYDVEIECTTCGTVHQTRDTWDRMLAKSENLLLTRTEIVHALSGFGVTVTANQLQGLTRRGRLIARGMSSGRPPRPMYRLGDVRDVLEGPGSVSA